MNATRPERYTEETSAHIILGVAKAISAHLELPDVLEALIVQLRPMVHFDAIGVVVLEGDYARLHSLHIEGMSRKAGESIQSIVARTASGLKIEPLKTKIPVSQHHMSVIKKSLRPYVCTDVETQRAFIRDDDFLKYGIRSYIGLPLMDRGEMIGVVDFVSL